MADAWKGYRGAPEDGARVCAMSDVPEGGTLCLDIAGYPILLAKVGGRVSAFVNACPHQYLPLNHKGDRLISADRTILRCTNHAAGFSIDSGEGVEGLGLGACLDAVPVAVEGDAIVIREDPRSGST